MRFAIAHPCLGSSEIVFRIKRSSVPWTRSFGFAILWLSTTAIVDCQGMAAGYNSWEVGESPMLRLAYFKLPRMPLTRTYARLEHLELPFACLSINPPATEHDDATTWLVRERTAGRHAVTPS